MGRPQQPELARSAKTDLDPDHVGTELEARKPPRSGGPTGPVPPENQPGHHPADEQDKPALDAFAARFGGDDRSGEGEGVGDVGPATGPGPAGTPAWPESGPAPPNPGPLGQRRAETEPAYVGMALYPLRATLKGLQWLERSLTDHWSRRTG
jgi:hypothetical protein